MREPGPVAKFVHNLVARGRRPIVESAAVAVRWLRDIFNARGWLGPIGHGTKKARERRERMRRERDVRLGRSRVGRPRRCDLCGTGGHKRSEHRKDGSRFVEGWSRGAS